MTLNQTPPLKIFCVRHWSQASGATRSYDVSANPPSVHKIIGVREGVLLEGRKKFSLKINNLP